MKRNALFGLILILVGLLVWLGWSWSRAGNGLGAASRGHGLAIAEAPKGGDFKLRAAKGAVALADFRGKVVLIYFGYTSCPDICPTNLAYIANALRRLTAIELDRVQVIFVSVDPERDDPAQLARYVAFFHPSILGVTGSTDAVARAAALYGAAYHKVEQSNSAMGYLVDHSAYTYVVDPAGRFTLSLDHATPPDRILEAIRTSLASAPSSTSP